MVIPKTYEDEISTWKCIDKIDTFLSNQQRKFADKIKVGNLVNHSMHLCYAHLCQRTQYCQSVKKLLNTLPRFARLIGPKVV